jgi:hypothetical protein
MALTNDTLTFANFGAFALHLVLGIVLTLWYFLTKTEGNGSIPTSLWRIVPCTDDLLCTKEDTTDNSALLITLMLVFVYFTAAIHLAYAVFPRWYHGMLNRSNNWMRWVEYAISATILLVVIAISSGVRDMDVIMLFILGSFAVMIAGDGIEKILKEKNEYAFKSGAHWSITTSAWAVLIGIFVVFGRSFQAQVDYLGDDLPSFVPAIVALTIILYASFGGIQLAQCFGLFKSFLQVEMSYISLSFISKALLSLLLTSGLVARK